MSKFTRKLYSQDPSAAEAYHRQARFEQELTQYCERVTLACYTPKKTTAVCAASCGNPACRDRCTLVGQFD